MAEVKKSKSFMAENTFANSNGNNITSLQSQSSLSRGKSVVGPRPLPTSTSSNSKRIDSSSSTIANIDSNSVNHSSEQYQNMQYTTTTTTTITPHIITNTFEQSRSGNPDAASTFPKLVSPKPHKPLPTVQNDITRALENQTPQQQTDQNQNNNSTNDARYPSSDTESWYAGDEKNLSQQQQGYFPPQQPQPQQAQSWTINSMQGPPPTQIQYPSPYNQPGRASEEITRTTSMSMSHSEQKKGHSSAPTSPIPPTLTIQEYHQYNNSERGGGPILSHSQSWNNMAGAGVSDTHRQQPVLTVKTDPLTLNVNNHNNGQFLGQGQYIQPNGVYPPNNQSSWNAPLLNGQQYNQYQNGRPISYGSGGIPSQQPSPNYFLRNSSPLGYARQPSPVQFGPDGLPLPSNRQSFYGPGRSPSPNFDNNRLSLAPRSPSPNFDNNRLSLAPRSPNTSNLRLLIDDKHAKRMTFTSYTLASDTTALQKYREAATKTNDPAVQVDYAKFLIGMTGFYIATNVNQDLDQNKTDTHTKLVNEAVYWIDKLARNNQPEAMYIKGTWYEYGKFTKEQNQEKALKYYMPASKQDHAKANTKIGEHYERQRNFGRAFSFLQKAASLGDVTALYRLALIYMLGDMKQEINHKQALIYLKQAASKADEDCPEGAFVYGMILAKDYHAANVPDELVVPDEREAIDLIQKAANLGYAPALYKMGVCYEYATLGCPFDPELSVSYYQRAADKGYVEADMALSKWYLCGAEGYFDQNEALAYIYAEKAAKKGLAAAEFAMGYFHEVGINTHVDPKIAHEWYSKAAVHGNQDAKERLSRGGTITRQEHEDTVQTKLKKQRKSDKDKDCVIQ
ncbi:13680_t:CDS:2 [Ambispora gerdemannii]|uniref:13680_t:CDS:1 n=1 Tax=Ambispora gerdemannii TaxID=144530 RepID=A0A9N8V8V8_9GLOM|nr:13680_t:CDS:2 [Ambispora gerdemannii]